MENLTCLNSIHCFPTVRKSSSKIDEFLLVTCFKESSSINEKFEYEVDRTTASIFSKAVGLSGNDSDIDDKKEQGEDHSSASFEETVHAESTESNLVLEMPESCSLLFEDSENSDINELNKNETSSISDELVNNKFSHSPIAATSNTETGLDSGVGVDISDEAVLLGRNCVDPETAMQETLGDSETYQDLARKVGQQCSLNFIFLNLSVDYTQPQRKRELKLLHTNSHSNDKYFWYASIDFL